VAKERAVERVMAAYDRFHERIAVLHAPEVVELSLTLAQLKAVYLAAAAGPIHMGALAVRLGTAVSTTSEVVERLVQMGLLDRTADPADRRQVLVSATPTALAQLEDISELGRGRMRDLLLRIPTSGDIETVERALRLLADAAGAVNEDITQ
jgi:DNA-binding MarR family transcriptional regulator